MSTRMLNPRIGNSIQQFSVSGSPKTIRGDIWSLQQSCSSVLSRMTIAYQYFPTQGLLQDCSFNDDRQIDGLLLYDRTDVIISLISCGEISWHGSLQLHLSIHCDWPAGYRTLTWTVELRALWRLWSALILSFSVHDTYWLYIAMSRRSISCCSSRAEGIVHSLVSLAAQHTVGDGRTDGRPPGIGRSVGRAHTSWIL